jgi:hypothetical protein
VICESRGRRAKCRHAHVERAEQDLHLLKPTL